MRQALRRTGGTADAPEEVCMNGAAFLALIVAVIAAAQEPERGAGSTVPPSTPSAPASSQVTAPEQPPMQPPPASSPREAPPPERALADSARKRWYVGLGVGLGDLTVQSDPWDPSELALSVRAGATMSRKLLLGLDVTYVGKSVSLGDEEVSRSVSAATAVATYFPHGGTIFVRGGLGLARFSDEARGSAGSTLQSHSIHATGVALAAGAGLEAGRTARLTVSLDLSGQYYFGDEGPEWTRVRVIGVGIAW